jgi:hypothetical protein
VTGSGLAFLLRGRVERLVGFSCSASSVHSVPSTSGSFSCARLFMSAIDCAELTPDDAMPLSSADGNML